ncbi:MAG TPA: hypothetical protein VEQ58_04970 [Polyangiaceae bacterium]|nr:hypothetical protein [Polyangiaceae bacterium]
MTPKNGGKFDLKLASSAPDLASYDAQLETGGQSYRGLVQVGPNQAGGGVDFGAWTSEGGAAPPEWLLADARAALKAALRTSRAEGRWPRRITRWRPEPSD